MPRSCFSRLPLTDRVAHWWDLWSGRAVARYGRGPPLRPWRRESPAWPRLLKRFDPLALLGLVTALMAARFGVIAVAGRPLQLAPASVLGGFANAGWDLVCLFCLLRLADADRFPLAMGLHTTLVGVRGLFTPGFGTWLYASGTASLPVLFSLMAAVTMAGAAGMLWYSARFRPAGSVPAATITR